MSNEFDKFWKDVEKEVNRFGRNFEKEVNKTERSIKREFKKIGKEIEKVTSNLNKSFNGVKKEINELGEAIQEGFELGMEDYRKSIGQHIPLESSKVSVYVWLPPYKESIISPIFSSIEKTSKSYIYFYSQLFESMAKGRLDISKDAGEIKICKQVGHASIDILSNYVTFYPGKKDASFKKRSLESKYRSYEKERAIRGKATHIIEIPGLDFSLMEERWNSLKNRRYNLLKLNCSTVVASILDAGAKGELLGELSDTNQTELIAKFMNHYGLSATELGKVLYTQTRYELLNIASLGFLSDFLQPSDILVLAEVMREARREFYK